MASSDAQAKNNFSTATLLKMGQRRRLGNLLVHLALLAGLLVCYVVLAQLVAICIQRSGECRCTSLDIGLTFESPRESLEPRHVGESLQPGGAPLVRGVGDLGGLPRGSARRVPLDSAGLLERLGGTAVATFHSRHFRGGDQRVAVAAAGKMPGDHEVGNVSCHL